MCHSYANRSGRRQQGFLIPLALVIIIGLAALAIGIAQLTSQSGSSAFREGISVQSFYAADSGVQYAMNRLFYPDPPAELSRATADQACVDLNSVTITYSVIGLDNCSATLSCVRTEDATAQISFYAVNSAAQCGDAAFSSERTIRASAYLEED